jgi:hypothetical protein
MLNKEPLAVDGNLPKFNPNWLTAKTKTPKRTAAAPAKAKVISLLGAFLSAGKMCLISGRSWTSDSEPGAFSAGLVKVMLKLAKVQVMTWETYSLPTTISIS